MKINAPTAMEQLLVIQEPEFVRCFQHWKEWWHKYVCAEGAYSEED
jgi:hypothetical protein